MKRAFTLVEVMLTVAILGLLIVILPSFVNSQKKNIELEAASTNTTGELKQNIKYKISSHAIDDEVNAYVVYVDEKESRYVAKRHIILVNRYDHWAVKIGEEYLP